MYQLNANSEFADRTRSVFDTLVNIEESHKTKAVSYVSASESELHTREPHDIEPVSQLTNKMKNLNDKAVFKIPKPIKRCYVKKHALSEKHPEKWTKYSMEDVKESGHGGNYAAAMSFLNSRNKLLEEDEEMSEPVEFNKPLGKNKKAIHYEPDKEEEVEDLYNSVEIKVESLKENLTIKKRSNRRNFRKQATEEEECSLINTKSLIKSRQNCSKKDDAISMEEDQCIESEEDVDANESNQYDLFD